MKVQISIPGTSLLITKKDTDILNWYSSPVIFSSENTTFMLKSFEINKNKYVNKDIYKVTYDDVFFITYGSENSIVVVNTEFSRLEIVKDSIEKIDNNKKFICRFKLESDMKGYYCDNGECKTVDIKDMQTFQSKGRYKNKTVGRNSNCWGICKYANPETNDYSFSSKKEIIKPSKSVFDKILVIIGLLSMIVIIISIIVILITKKVFS
jgi:hypothetical protein